MKSETLSTKYFSYFSKKYKYIRFLSFQIRHKMVNYSRKTVANSLKSAFSLALQDNPEYNELQKKLVKKTIDNLLEFHPDGEEHLFYFILTNKIAKRFNLLEDYQIQKLEDLTGFTWNYSNEEKERIIYITSIF